MTERKDKSPVLSVTMVILSAAAAVTAAVMLSHKAASAVMIICMSALLLLLMILSGRGRSPVYLSTVAVMTALSAVGRMVFAAVSGFKPCTAIIMITGITLGGEAGFICGALTALVSNIYFGQGSWTLFQMFSWGIIGLFAGVFSKALEKNKPLLYVYAVFSGAFYSLLMDFFSVLWADGKFNLSRFLTLAAGSLPFTAVYAVSNIIFIALMYRRLSNAVNRVSVKYGIKDQKRGN